MGKIAIKMLICQLFLFSPLLSENLCIFFLFPGLSAIEKNVMFSYAAGGREAVKKIAQIAEVMTFPVQKIRKKERRRKNWRRRETEK